MLAELAGEPAAERERGQRSGSRSDGRGGRNEARGVATEEVAPATRGGGGCYTCGDPTHWAAGFPHKDAVRELLARRSATNLHTTTATPSLELQFATQAVAVEISERDALISVTEALDHVWDALTYY
jgi:hypothetical protein